MIKKLLITLIVLWIGLSLVPLQRDTKALGEVIGNDKVHAVLQRACFDCHSYQTKWPWYSYVFPTNFFVYNHVREGRTELNFHHWSELPISKQSIKIDNMIEEIENKEMPLKSYLLLHTEAQITEEDLKVLREWQKEVETDIQELEIEDDE